MGNIKIRSVLVSECYTNCYLCMNTDTKEGFIVDPGDDALKISVNVSNIEMIPKAILLTRRRQAFSRYKSKFIINVWKSCKHLCRQIFKRW